MGTHSKPSTQEPSTTIGWYLLDRLQSCGIEHIFGVPGDYVLQFNKMVEKHPIHFINTTRENTAGYMADAYARVRGMGAACITYGVGINIMNAVTQAYVESSPLVIISGAASTKEFLFSQHLHHLFDQPCNRERDTTQLEILKNVTVAQTVLDNPATAKDEIERVIEACLSQKKPVYIELPRDRVATPLEMSTVPPQRKLSCKTDAATLEEVMAEVKSVLKASRQPVIWAGHELHRHNLTNCLLQFAENSHIPIASSLLGKSVISEHHPLFIGLYQGKLSQEDVREYVESSDCVLILGVMLNDVDTGMFTVCLENCQKIHVSTEVIAINHHQYKDISFSDFMKALAKLDLNMHFTGNYPANIGKITPNFEPQKNTKITSSRLFEALQSHLTQDNIIVSDFGDCLFGSAELTVEKGAFFSNAYFASLGFGVPGAIGVQLASPKKRVICVVGDGAFQMTCTELSTAVRYDVDLVVVLLNNHGYATERPLLEGEYNDIVNWNYSEFPRILNGGVGLHVDTEEEFDHALKNALAAKGQFHLIEVDLDKMDFSPALQRFCRLVKNKK